MIIKPLVSSATFGGDGISETTNFDDYSPNLDPQYSITKIEFNTGWVVDGMRVTYRDLDGIEFAIPHGTFSAGNVGNKFFTLSAGEYISKVEGVHGHPNGNYDYGDCIQKIRFTIKSTNSSQVKVTPYYGAAQYLPPNNAITISWEGRLHSFAGITKDTYEVKLKGLSFTRFGDPVVLATSIPYGGIGRSLDLLGQDYDDINSFGNRLKLSNPIKSIGVWSDQSIVHGLEIVYNMSDGATNSVMHGAQGGTKSTVDLAATENIIEIKGIHGNLQSDQKWADQIQILEFTIQGSSGEPPRTAGPFGAGANLDQETRKDIYVRGTLMGIAGTANNGVPVAGLNVVKFYTKPPTQGTAA
ncbi:Jacalin-like lectin domain protein [Ceratobasidium sp. AG-Ba]|nr:Jacalin-like lectin domain protein [Ceratobasidium sp. AG-Ba]